MDSGVLILDLEKTKKTGSMVLFCHSRRGCHGELPAKPGRIQVAAAAGHPLAAPVRLNDFSICLIEPDPGSDREAGPTH
jgi:hypothetical protein